MMPKFLAKFSDNEKKVLAAAAFLVILAALISKSGRRNHE